MPIVTYIFAGSVALGIALAIRVLVVRVFNGLAVELNRELRYELWRRSKGLIFIKKQGSFLERVRFRERREKELRNERLSRGPEKKVSSEIPEYKIKQIQEKGLSWKRE